MTFRLTPLCVRLIISLVTRNNRRFFLNFRFLEKMYSLAMLRVLIRSVPRLLRKNNVTSVLHVNLSSIQLTRRISRRLHDFLILANNERHRTIRQRRATLLQRRPNRVQIVVSRNGNVTKMMRTSNYLTTSRLVGSLVRSMNLRRQFLHFRNLRRLIRLFQNLKISTNTILRHHGNMNVATIIRRRSITHMLLVPRIDPFYKNFLRRNNIMSSANNARRVKRNVNINKIVVQVAMSHVSILKIKSITMVRQYGRSLNSRLYRRMVQESSRVMINHAKFRFNMRKLIKVGNNMISLSTNGLLRNNRRVRTIVEAIKSMFTPIMGIRNRVLTLGTNPIMVIQSQGILNRLGNSNNGNKHDATRYRNRHRRRGDGAFRFASSPLDTF